MSDEDVDEPEPVISIFPVAGRYHIDLCEDPDCERHDHVEVSRPVSEAR